MGYVAVKGGQEAIENALEMADVFRWKNADVPLRASQIKSQFRFLIDKIMGEASLYAPEQTALALQQCEGDVFEGAFMMRAFRATLQRRYYSEILDTRTMLIERRISSSFRDIPGGQILGPTRDYSLRLLEPEKAEMDVKAVQAFLSEVTGHSNAAREVRTFGKVIDILTKEGLLSTVPEDADRRVVDVTREAIKFPAPRSAVLQMLARAETGGLMTLGYSTMRGFATGGHGTIGELRVGWTRVYLTDGRGRKRYTGKVKVTECEMLAHVRIQKNTSQPTLSFGYGLCYGQNETKAICMSMLDNSLRTSNPDLPANSQEFVLYHTDVIEAYGFTNHLKLPHYVTFQAGLQNVRDALKRGEVAETPATDGVLAETESASR
jgi:alpha-D-ribose 1-methylphosphonate 5-triphosphate synthase subunit PhnI